MSHRLLISLAVATTTVGVALAAVSTALAVTSGPKVTIRIEGARSTLLTTRTVQARASGSIDQDGAPPGKCPADSAAGALNVATNGSWGGSWSSKYGDYLITKILGDTASGTKSYWEILIDDVAATTGVCELKLDAGEQLLFAVVSATGKGYPLVIKAPATGTAGSSLKVMVDAVNGKGMAVPLAGATLSGAGATATTNTRGIATLQVKSAGTLTLGASETGYVRAARVMVKVTS
jgi:hypothetical protein